MKDRRQQAAEMRALDDADRKLVRPPGRPPAAERDPARPARPVGGTRAAGLRRLRKDAPSLHALVLSGDLSVHQAMVWAGLRQVYVSVPMRVTDVDQLDALASHRQMSRAALARRMLEAVVTDEAVLARVDHDAGERQLQGE